jgi:hypothetical protein
MKMRSGGRKRAAETENGLSRLEMGGGDWKWVVEPENEWYGIRESGCNNAYFVHRLFSVIRVVHGSHFRLIFDSFSNSFSAHFHLFGRGTNKMGLKMEQKMM